MNNKTTFQSLRTFVLGLLFIIYYVGIGLICWPLFSDNPDAIKWILIEKPFFILLLAGFGSGWVLWMSTLPGIELVIRQSFRERNWKGLMQMSCYCVINFALAIFPIFLMKMESVFHRWFTPRDLFLIIITFLMYMTYRRFKGLGCK